MDNRTASSDLPSVLPASLIVSEGFQGMAHGTVFITKVQRSELKRGITGRMFDNQRPIRLNGNVGLLVRN